MAAGPEGLRGEHQVLHHQAFLDAVHVDHLPPLEVPQVDGVRVVEQSRLHERPQRVVAKLPVDKVVAVRAVEVEEHGRDALPGDVRDGYEDRRALGVDDPLVEAKEVRSPPGDVEPAVLQLDCFPVEGVLRLERLVLDV